MFNRNKLLQERRRALAIQQDEQHRRDREDLHESIMQAHLRHKEGLQARFIMQEEQYRQDMEDRDNAGMQTYLRHNSIAQARRALQRSVTDPRSVAFDSHFSSILVSPLA